jgi:hypothetical protein
MPKWVVMTYPARACLKETFGKIPLKKESKNIYRDVRHAFERDWKVIRE